MLNTYRSLAMDELRLAAGSEKLANCRDFSSESRGNMRAKAQRHRCKASDFFKMAANCAEAKYIHIED